MINVSDKRAIEKIQTHILCSTVFPEIPTIGELMWKKI
jgi:hypothetical protein